MMAVASRTRVAFFLATLFLVCSARSSDADFSDPIEIHGADLYYDHVEAEYDVDGDGDRDVVAGYGWFENLDGAGTFGPLQSFDEAVCIVERCIDFDHDGDVDVVGRRMNAIYLYRNDGWGGFDDGRYLTYGNAGDGAFGELCVLDLGRDGDYDIVWGEYRVLNFIDSMPLHVWENTSPATFEGREYSEASGLRSVQALAAGDFDGDGDDDLAVGGYHPYRWDLIWFENTDEDLDLNAASTAVDHLYSDHPSCLRALDLSGDGDLDIALAGYRGATWIENSDGVGGFDGLHGINDQTREPVHLAFGDLDGDTDMDVVVVYDDYEFLAWQENANGEGGFGASTVLSTEIGRLRGADCADVDGDGHVDIVCSTRSGVYWLRNQGGDVSNEEDPQDGDLQQVAGLGVLQVRPNPFNPSTEISFTLAKPGTVRVAIYDLGGGLVKTLRDGACRAGTISDVWRAEDETGRTVTSGVYLLHVETEQGKASRTLTVMK